MNGHDFYDSLIMEISSAESYLEDAIEENIEEDEAMCREYLTALLAVKTLASKIYDV